MNGMFCDCLAHHFVQFYPLSGYEPHITMFTEFKLFEFLDFVDMDDYMMRGIAKLLYSSRGLNVSNFCIVNERFIKIYGAAADGIKRAVGSLPKSVKDEVINRDYAKSFCTNHTSVHPPIGRLGGVIQI